MLRATDRSQSRRDTAALLICTAISFLVLLAPDSLGRSVSSRLRDTVLAPLVWLQSRAAEGRTSRERFRVVTAQRDTATLIAQNVPALEAENSRLRELLALSRRAGFRHVAAEVLHQSAPTDGRMLLVDAGQEDGIVAFQPVVAPEGLIGVVASTSARTASVMTWAHPDFRVSAFTERASIFGVVAPAGGSVGSEALLEFRAASYRDTLATGTLVLSSGLGGVYPKGIPIGTVAGIAREQEGWERVYSLRPSASPSATAHVMILTGQAESVERAFPTDSVLAALRADSARQRAAADSALRLRLADSVRRALLDSVARAAQVPAGAAQPPAAPAAP